ncbi:MAG: response regulator [Bacteroidota bacterium]
MSKKISVMLIDDNKIDLFIHHELIRQMDITHQIAEYPFATEALKFLEENDGALWPDLILLDIHMPVMNGFDFLDKYALLPHESRKKCKVIAVSSSLDTGDKLRANENPMVLQLMEKPLNTGRLKSLLQSEQLI